MTTKKEKEQESEQIERYMNAKEWIVKKLSTKFHLDNRYGVKNECWTHEEDKELVQKENLEYYEKTIGVVEKLQEKLKKMTEKEWKEEIEEGRAQRTKDDIIEMKRCKIIIENHEKTKEQLKKIYSSKGCSKILRTICSFALQELDYMLKTEATTCYGVLICDDNHENYRMIKRSDTTDKPDTPTKEVDWELHKKVVLEGNTGSIKYLKMKMTENPEIELKQYERYVKFRKELDEIWADILPKLKH